MDTFTNFLSSSLDSYLTVMTKFSEANPVLFYSFTIGATLMMLVFMTQSGRKKDKGRDIFDISARIENPSWYSVSISAVIVYILMIPVRLLSYIGVGGVRAIIFLELKVRGYK